MNPTLTVCLFGFANTTPNNNSDTSKILVRMSARLPTTLAEVFNVFLQENVWIVP
jgi:hypothetical protein